MVQSQMNTPKLKRTFKTVPLSKSQNLPEPSMSQESNLTLFIKMPHLKNSMVLQLPVSSQALQSTTTSQIQALIYRNLGMKSQFSKLVGLLEFGLTFDGQRLKSDVDLRSQNVQNYSTLVCRTQASSQGLLGGSEQFAPKSNKVDAIERQSESKQQQQVTDFSWIDVSDKMILKSDQDEKMQEIPLQQEETKTEEKINDPNESTLELARSILANPLGMVQEILSLDSIILEARRKLLVKYQVPEIIEQITRLKEPIRGIRELLYASVGYNSSEVNIDLVEQIKEYDIDQLGSLDFEQIASFLKNSLSSFEISLDESQLIDFIKTLGANKDGRFQINELVHKFCSDAEVEEYFAYKTKDLQAKKAALLEEKKSKAKNVEDKNADESSSSIDSERDRQESNLQDQIEEFDEAKIEKVKTHFKKYQGSDDIESYKYGENFLEKLIRLEEEQSKAIETFDKKMQENALIHKDGIQKQMSHMAKTEKWLSRLTQNQYNLVQVILMNAAEEGTNISQGSSFADMISDVSLKTTLHLIVALGPQIYELRVYRAENLVELRFIFDLVKSANNASFLNQLMQSVESPDVRAKEAESFMQNLSKQFQEAQYSYQKQLMLISTNSIALRKRWIQMLSAEQMIMLVRPITKTQEADFSLLALGSDDQQKKINEMFSPTEQKRFSAWKLKKQIGYPHIDFKELEQAQRHKERKIKLPLDTKYLYQVASPGKAGEFFRVERQVQDFNASFVKSTDHSKNMDNDMTQSEYYITRLQYCSVLKKLEPVQSVRIEQPLSLKSTQTFLNQNAVIFFGLRDEVFFFSKSQGGQECRVNILAENLDEQLQQTVIIKEGSQLHQYVSQGNNLVVDLYYSSKLGFPQVEPTLKRVKDDFLVIFSYFKFGSKPSVCIYSTKLNRELVQLSGANMFLQELNFNHEADLVDKTAQQTEYFLIYAHPKLCETIVKDKNKMKDIIEDTLDSSLCYKQYAFDYESLIQSEKQTVEFSVSPDDIVTGKLDELDPEDPFSNSFFNESGLFFYETDGDLFTREKGVFKVINHIGPNNRKFFAMQVTNIDDGNDGTINYNCRIYEILEPKRLKMVCNESGFLVTQDENKFPHLMQIDEEKKRLDLLSLFEQESGKLSEIKVFSTVLPDEYLFSGQEERQLAKNLFSQPSLVDGVLLTSCLSDEFEQTDLQFKKADTKSDQKAIFGANVAIGELSIDRPNMAQSWKLHSSYPLLACANSDRANELIVTHMTNGQRELAQFRLDTGQLICFVHLQSYDKDSKIAFLSSLRQYDANETKQELVLFQLELQIGFKKNAFMEKQNWSINKNVLKGTSYSKLYELRDRIKRVIHFTNQKSVNYAFLCQTDCEILLITESNVQVIFESKSDSRLMEQNMILSQNGKTFFITQELSSQTSFLHELSTDSDAITSMYKTTCNKVYTFQSGTVLEMQLDRDFEQKQCFNYRIDGHRPEQSAQQSELIILDSNLNLCKLRQEETGEQFVQVTHRSLKKLEVLKQALKSKSRDENASMSDRTIIFRDKLYMIESGNVFDALSNHSRSGEDQTVLSSELVPKSDKIVYKICGPKHIELVLKCDAGRRNCSPLGHDQIRDCTSANFISQNLMLFQIRRDQIRTYQTLITDNEEIKEVPQELNNIFKEINADIQSRIVDGNVCQLLTLRKCTGILLNYKAHLIRLSQFADVISIKEIDWKGDYDKEIVDLQLIQNHRGEVLAVLTEKFVDENKDEIESVPEQSPYKLYEDGKVKPLQVYFKLGVKGTKYILAGDYLCWLSPSDSLIQVMKIFGPEPQASVKIINYEENISKTPQQCLRAINEINPFVAIKQAKLDTFDDLQIERLANQIQLTLESRAFILDLNQDNPLPVNEIAAMHQLDDPHNYVDSSFELSTMTEQISVKYEIEDYKIYRGNIKHGLQEKYESQQQGDSYLVTQVSNLPIQQTQEEDLNYRVLLGIYKKFCEADLREVNSLLSAAERGIKPKKLDYKTLWASFGNQNLLSVLGNNLRVLTAIKDCLQGLELKNLEEKDGTETSNPDLSRLNNQMMKKIYFEEAIEDTDTMKLKSLLKKNLRNSGHRDALLKIGRLSPEFNVINLFEDQEDFSEMIRTGSPQTMLELQNCFAETGSTRLLQLLDWPRDLRLLTLMKETSIINKSDLEDMLKSHQNRVTRTVNVSMMEMKWFYRNKKNFIAFTQMLQKLPHKAYDSIFVQSLLEQFWKDSQKRIIKEQFIPYMVFVICSIWYFVNALDRVREKDPINSHIRWLIWILSPVLILLWCYLVRLEIKQIRGLSKRRDYFKRFWNWNDLIGLSLTLIIVATSLTPETLLPLGELRIMAAIASCTLLIKMYDWLRLFENTSFYILLVEETMRDMRAFVILLLITILMYGFPMLILNLNRSKEDENLVIGESLGFSTFDMLINQYLLSLGEYEIDNFANQPQSYMCYILFIAATFSTQVVMLNMLIAIMGDTFERVIENRDVNAIKTKLQLIGDLVATLEQTSTEDEKKYFMFIVQPDDDNIDDNDDWEGTINKITRLTAENVDLQTEKLHKKSAALQESLDEFVKKDVVQDRHLRIHVDKLVKSSQSKIFDRISKFENTIKANQAELNAYIMKQVSGEEESEHEAGKGKSETKPQKDLPAGVQAAKKIENKSSETKIETKVEDSQEHKKSENTSLIAPQEAAQQDQQKNVTETKQEEKEDKKQEVIEEKPTEIQQVDQDDSEEKKQD